MDLVDPAKENVDKFVPKVWVHRGNTTNGELVTDGGAHEINTRVYLPKYITTGNILGLHFGPSLGYEIYTFSWMGGRSFVDTGDNGTSEVYNHMVHYEKLYHSIRIEVASGATSMDNAQYIMSVFYKP